MPTRLKEIKINPGNMFFCAELPDELKIKYQTITELIKSDTVVDHVTLVFIPGQESSLIDQAVNVVLDVAGDHPPIKAKVQGWAYFDGDSDVGTPKTMLVALVDAPGLSELYVDIVRALKKIGVGVSRDHGFTPHMTFASLQYGERIDDLPILDDEFMIDNIMTATSGRKRIPLLGSIEESLVKQYIAQSLKEAIGEKSFGGGDAKEERWLFDGDSIMVPSDVKKSIKRWMKKMKLTEGPSEPVGDHGIITAWKNWVSAPVTKIDWAPEKRREQIMRRKLIVQFISASRLTYGWQSFERALNSMGFYTHPNESSEGISVAVEFCRQRNWDASTIKMAMR